MKVAQVGLQPGLRASQGRGPCDVLAPHLGDAKWTRQALDMVESHSLTGKPGGPRWCSRCTLKLAADWKTSTKPLPPACGDPRIKPRMAGYDYLWDGGACRIRPANPHYSGASVQDG